MHTVVVGGGFGGVKTALELSKRNTGKITLISDEPYFLHHATLYATATGRAKAESVIQLEDIFKNHGNVTVVHDKMKSIDTARRLVVGGKKSYHYDKLVIAIGVVTTYFNIDGMSSHSYGIKTLKEVKKFKKHLHDELTLEKRFDKNYFVIGAGPTGVELAGALVEYLNRIAEFHHIKHAKPRIVLVEAADRILPRMSKTASKKVHKQLEKQGVKILTGKMVESLDDDEIMIAGKKYPTQTAVWTSGVTNHPFFKKHADVFELAPNGRVVVDSHMMAAPNIFVIGDNAATPYTGLAWTALKDADFVAKHLARIRSKQPLKPANHRSFVSGVPTGDNWAYVEKSGIYAAGWLGAWLRRRIELNGYLELVPRQTALAAWKAHDQYEEDCTTCKKSLNNSL